MNRPGKIGICNESGMSMVELLIAAVISIILLGVGVFTFTKQQTTFNVQNDNTALRAKARQAVKTLAQEIRKAGYGMGANQAIISANNTSIKFRTNTDNKITWLRSDVSAGATSMTVSTGGAAQFAVGDRIAIQDIKSGTYEMRVIASVDAAADTLSVTSGLTNAYASANAVMISKYHTIEIQLSGTSVTREDDGGNTSASSTTVPLVGNVAASGFDLDYFDNTNTEITTMPVGTPSSIRKVEIYLKIEDPKDATITSKMETEVNIRNMGS